MAYLQDQFAAASDVPEVELQAALQQMEADTTMSTPPCYTPNGTLYPDHILPFTDKHMLYLKQHPKINAEQYLANLRMKVRIR